MLTKLIILSNADDLVHVRTEGHHGHHLVVGLVRVGEERNLLAGYQRVVEVDAGDTRGNQLRGLLSLVRVDGRASDVAAFSLHLRASVDRPAVGVEETPGQVLAYVEGGRFSEKCHFGVCRYAFGTLEYLEGDGVFLHLHHLGQAAVHSGELIV